jgi:diguanylate cyclase (GGDEF)-like protein/PAS domain S-box-containing protein
VSEQSRALDAGTGANSEATSYQDLVDELGAVRQEAHDERTRLAATLDGLLDPHVYLSPIVDAAGRMVDFRFDEVNRAAARYFEVLEPDLVGARLLLVLPDLAAAGLLDVLADVVRTGEPLKRDDMPYTNVHLAEDHWFDVRATRIADGLSFSWRDVTSRHTDAVALADSEERFRLLAENSSDVVYLTGPDKRIRWVAPSVRRTLGFAPEELIGTEALDLAHPDDRDDIERVRDRVYSEGHLPSPSESQGNLLRVRTRSGEYRWVVASNSVVYDDEGILLGVNGSMRDVDELVRAREAATLDRERLELTLDAMLDSHAFLEPVLDSDDQVSDFTFVHVNKAGLEYLRLERAELEGHGMLTLMPGMATTGLLARFVEAYWSGVPLDFPNFPYPNEVVQADRRYDIRVVRVGTGLSLTWRDVTDRYLAARALEESEAMYRMLSDNSSDVVYQLRDGVFTWVSPSVLAGLGWTPADLVGRPSLDFIHPDDHQRIRAGRAVMEAGRRVRRRYRFLDSHGVYHWVDSNGTPVAHSDGTSDGVVVSMRIVDNEVRAQEALELRARQDQLTGLANRDAVFEQLAAILGRSQRTGREVAVVFCDVDDFKSVNDHYGHAGGDEVLRVVAARLQAGVRRDDLVARIGGDELLVVLDGVHDLDEAVRIADKLRLAVAAPVSLPSGQVGCTISLGVTLALPGESLDDVVARSDAAMYVAKQSGRDQVFPLSGG